MSDPPARSPARLFDATAKRYVSVGLLITVLSYAFLGTITIVFGQEGLAANFATLVFGLILSFILNRSYSFRYKGSNRRALLRFIVVVAIAYGVNLLVLMGLLATGLVPDWIAQFAGFSVYTVIAYFLHRSWTFAGSGG